MKRIILLFLCFAWVASFPQISGRCPQCPPSPVGHAGEVLGTDGTFLEWVPGGSGGVVTNALTTTLDTTRWGGDLNRNTRIITDTFAVDFISDTTLPSYSTLYHLGTTTYPYEVPFLITLFRGQHYGVLKMDENQYYQLIANDSIGWESVVQNQIAPDGSSIFNGGYTHDVNTGLFYQNICYQQFSTGASNVEMSIYKDANAAHVARDIGGLHLRYGSEGAALHTILTDTTADAPYGLYGWQNKDYVTFAPQSSGDGTAYPAKFSVTVDGAIQRFDSGAYSYTAFPHQAPFDSCLIIYDALGNPYLKDISSFGGGSGWALTGNNLTGNEYLGSIGNEVVFIRSGEFTGTSNVTSEIQLQKANEAGDTIGFAQIHVIDSANQFLGGAAITNTYTSISHGSFNLISDTSTQISVSNDSITVFQYLGGSRQFIYFFPTTSPAPGDVMTGGSNNSLVFAPINASQLDASTIPLYPDNATAVSAIGEGKFYATDVSGEYIVKITHP